MIFWVSIIIWLTIFATLSPGSSEGGFAAVAKFKILVRALSITVLGWMIFSHFRNLKIQQIVLSYWPWAMFAAWAITSTLWSPMTSISLGQAGGQVSLIMLSTCVAISFRQGHQQYLKHCMIALAVYCAVFGVGSLVLPDVVKVARSSLGRVVHPTALGAAASLGLVAMTSLLVASSWKWVKPLAIVALPIFAIAMVASHNRLGLGLAVALCPIVVLIKGQSHGLAAIGLVMSILGTCYLVLDPGLVLIEDAMGTGASFVQRGQSSTQLAEFSGRNEMWSKMWGSYLEAPLIGHGYFVCSSTGTLYVWFIEQNHTAHNIFLQALVTTGVVGFAIFVIWQLQFVRLFILATGQRFKSSEIATLVPILVLWALGWSMLNSFILGPIRPESVVYTIAIGLIVGRYHYRDQVNLFATSNASIPVDACAGNSVNIQFGVPPQ